MKAAGEKTTPGAVDIIQGVRAEEFDVTCVSTTTMPESSKQFMPTMTMKSVRRLWLATPSERLRVPGLWQLSGFESWQEYFSAPSPDPESEGEKTITEALRRGQSATLRERTEMSMKLPDSPGPDGYTQFFGTSEEMVSLSTEVLDDALFRVPADFREEPLETVSKGISAAVDSEIASRENDAAPKPAIPENVKAFIPVLFPLRQTEPAAPLGPDGQKLQGMVELLVTVGPQGNVEQAEVLSGPEGLRQAATEAVKQWTFRPVIRDGAPVTAYTQATVNFIDFSKGPPDMSAFKFTPEMEAADDRIEQLRAALPRTPEQEFADLEQDSGGGDKSRRYDRLGELALRAARLGADDKAKTYATEVLAEGQADGHSWNYGNAIHDGHIVLGLLALHHDDVTTAGQELLEAGKTPGSPTLNSFGPDMTLANELLKKGERDTVLQYLELCRKFWKMGAERLDSWSAAVREGMNPTFGPPLH
jgi:TonB family protein